MVQELGTVAIEEQGEVTLIRLLGEHDLATAGDLRRALGDAVAAGSGAIVSVEETEFIDASVISELFVGDRLLRAAGQRLVLHVGTAPIVLPGRLRVQVLDLGTGAPDLMPHDPDPGLSMVEKISDRWSGETDGSFNVWLEIDTEPILITRAS